MTAPSRSGRKTCTPAACSHSVLCRPDVCAGPELCPSRIAIFGNTRDSNSGAEASFAPWPNTSTLLSKAALAFAASAVAHSCRSVPLIPPGSSRRLETPPEMRSGGEPVYDFRGTPPLSAVEARHPAIWTEAPPRASVPGRVSSRTMVPRRRASSRIAYIRRDSGIGRAASGYQISPIRK